MSASAKIEGHANFPEPSSALSRYFEISLFLMLLVSVLALVSTGKLDLVTIVLAPAAVLVKGYRWWHGRGPELSPGTATFLVVIYFIYFQVDLWWISPLLSNVYLHYVFDLWVQHWRTHRITGDIIVVRYADDMVLGFQHRDDAERFLQDWRGRLQKFELELHPDKTRLIEFGRFAAISRKQRGEGKPETFNFLGFAHICGQARKNGKFLVLRKSIRKRLLAKLKQVKDELRRRMHQPLAEVGKWLKSVVRGYFNFHAVPGNFASLQCFRLEVSKRWLRVIQRRSQKSRMSWKHMAGFVKQWLPLPKILHPYPYLRFDAKHPR